MTHTESYGPLQSYCTTDIFNCDERVKSKYSSTLLDGVCVYIGAQTSVCGRRKAEVYCKAVNIPLVILPSKINFNFGNVVSLSRGVMRFRLPCPDCGSLEMDIDIVDLDIPLLLGLRELR